MIAQEDLELWSWIENAHREAGSFLRAITRAALYADAENYKLLRPILLEFKAKYPKFNTPMTGTRILEYHPEED